MAPLVVHLITLCITILLRGLHCEFTVGIFTINNRYPITLGSMPYSAAAMDLAVEQVRRQYRDVFDVTLTYLSDESAKNCDDLTALASHLLSKAYYTKNYKFNISVTVFPGCSEQIEVINLTREWKILTILGATSGGTSGAGFRDRALYPHVISAGPANPAPYGALAKAIFLTYGWKNSFVVYDSSPSRPFYKNMGIGTAFVLKRYANVNVRMASILCTANQSFASVLEDFGSQARVFVFLGHPSCTRRLLVEAYKNRMTTGEYVYITQDVQKNTTVYGTLDWRNNDDDDLIAREAFQSLLTYGPIEALVPASRLAAFNEEVKRRSRMDYNFTYPLGEQVNTVARALFDTVHMVAQVVNASYGDYMLSQNRSVFNAVSLASRFLDQTFVLPMGEMYIDKGGERAETPGFFSYDPDSMDLTQVLFATVDKKRNLVEVRQPVWRDRWPVPNVPACGYQGNEGPCAPRGVSTTTVAVASGAACVVCIVAATVAFRKLRRQLLLRDYWWRLDENMVALEADEICGPRQCTPRGMLQSAVPLWTLHATLYYNNKCVHLRAVQATSHNVLENMVPLSAFLLKVRTLQHTNVNSFTGMLYSTSAVRFVEEHCFRGDLRLFYKVGCKIDNFVFRRGLVADFLKGLKFIHESTVKHHGDLQPRRCLLDGRFTLKITAVGYDRLVDVLTPPSCGGNHFNPFHKLSDWTAPEHRKMRKKGTPMADVYAAGLILQELIGDYESKFCSPPDNTDIVTESRIRRFPDTVKHLFRECTVGIPKNRPATPALCRRYFRAVGPEKTSAVGYLLKRLERYANDLEDSVAARSLQLTAERTKCDELLCEMLPRSIVIELRRGAQPAPELFDAATISFTSIAGFATLVVTASPEEVMAFLTKAHGLFDGIILYHDVYKVESIADSYLTASGLPVRNDNGHAEESCRMAMRFQSAFSEAFRGMHAAARTGIHTGPCIAAVVGSKRPRYCVFGDTINTASRMESHGEGGKIQISSATASFLKSDELFCIISRGTVHVKGKGEMATFWLQ